MKIEFRNGRTNKHVLQWVVGEMRKRGCSEPTALKIWKGSMKTLWIMRITISSWAISQGGRSIERRMGTLIPRWIVQSCFWRSRKSFQSLCDTKKETNMYNKKVMAVSLAVLFSLTLSLIFPVGVLADDNQPPATEIPEVVTPRKKLLQQRKILPQIRMFQNHRTLKNWFWLKKLHPLKNRPWLKRWWQRIRLLPVPLRGSICRYRFNRNRWLAPQANYLKAQI